VNVLPSEEKLGYPNWAGILIKINARIPGFERMSAFASRGHPIVDGSHRVAVMT
jgi:hypothetical protein